MKILTVKNALKAAVALPFLSGIAVSAISLTDLNVVGVFTKDNPSHDDVLIQQLLDLTLPGLQVKDDPFNNNKHIAYDTDHPEYAGTVHTANNQTVGNLNGNATTVGAGFDFIVAKYGPSAIVFYSGGASFDLPATIQDIFPSDPDNNGQGQGANGGGLSGYVAYKGTTDLVVPPEGNLPDGGTTAVLLGGGISALALLRRKLS